MIVAASINRMVRSTRTPRILSKRYPVGNVLTLFQCLTQHIRHGLGFTAQGKQLHINHEKEIHFKIRTCPP